MGRIARVVRGAAAVVIALGAITAPDTPVSAVLPAPLSAASFDGEPLQYIHTGSAQFTDVVSLGLRGPNMLMFNVAGAGLSYQVWFAPPDLQQMAVGTYEAAQRADFRAAGHPGIDIFGMGRGCNTVSGRFIVDQVEFAPDGTPTVFSARFEHHCEGSAPALFGSISYNATADYRWRLPSANVIDFASNVGGTASVTMTNAGPSTLTMYPTVLAGTDAGDFQIVADECSGRVLGVNASCAVTVRFAPRDRGRPHAAALAFFDDVAPPGGSGRRVSLSGVSVSPAGEFTPLTPARILDTRDGTGGFSQPLGPGVTFEVAVTGVGGVPASGVAAVVMNATATNGTAPTFVTVWPAGLPRPENSNLNLLPGESNPNLVTVAVGANGKVGVFNADGNTDVVFDVVGFYSAPDGPRGSRFSTTDPIRLFDTRNGTGGVPARPIGPDGELVASVFTGIVPPAATAIVMNVTATRTTSAGFLSVYPADGARPLVSNLNFGPNRTVPNLVTVRVPADGRIAFYNAFGSTHVVADLVGYYMPSDTARGRFVGITPARALDTRLEQAGSLGPDEFGILKIAGFNGVPEPEAMSVVINVTATGTTSAGFLTLFPDDLCQIPNVSNLNFGPGQTIPNLAIVRLSTSSGCAVRSGSIDVYNGFGNTHVIIDVFGYFI